MNDPQLLIHIAILIILIILSAFFSSSETGMMSVNRYKLKHWAQSSKNAQRVQKLLKRPDRLLGMILLGNTFVNISAGAIATVIAVDIAGEQVGVILSSVITTFLLLIFGEVSPKTLAAVYPEKVAFPASGPLQFLLWLFHPLVWSINAVSNTLLKLCGIKLKQTEQHGFSREELRTIVRETSGRIPSKHRNMLLSILDLEKVLVDDIMIPSNEVVGLDLTNDWDAILAQLSNTQHTFLPVYEQDLNNLVGILHAKRALHLIADDDFNEEKLRAALEEALFVPQGTSLTTQMINFQKTKQRFALVVDEYGDIQGLITLEDILEEIVGEFTTNMSAAYTSIFLQADGSYLVEASTSIREFNRIADWKLPTDSANKTINGLVIEYLQSIPEVGTCCLIGGNIPIEVVQVQDNRIKTIKILPPIARPLTPEGS